MCKDAKKQGKPNEWNKASITISHGAKKGVYQAHQHHGDVSHKWSHSNKPQEGQMKPHKQVAPKIDKHKPTECLKLGKV